MGAALASAFRDENALYSSVEPEERAGRVGVSARIETLIVAVFPFDVLAVGEFGPAAPRLQAALRRSVVDVLKAMVDPQYASLAHFSDVPDLMDRRFLEYGVILHGQFSQGGLQRFSFAAARNILGAVDPVLAMQIALHFAMTMKHIGPTLRHYELKT